MSSPTSNFDKWQCYFQNIPSPQSYIDFAYYFLISASLQRRVWTGSKEKPLFPNTYTFLVGDPGIGKGNVIKPVIEMLRHFRIEPSTGKIFEHDETKVTPEDEGLLLFPAAPESTTYESLVSKLARSMRRVSYNKEQYGGNGLYAHNSMFFALEEISSLFKKNTENIVNFLIVGYDCGDYRRETKTQGTDQIKKCCLNFFGGTTPSFMEATFNDALLNEGMSSRCWFIYEFCNRFRKWGYSDFTSEQLECKREILDHIKKLAMIYGQVEFTAEADEYMRNWWLNEEQVSRANTSIKLGAYYARKDIHVKKLATILHFSEPGFENMTIGLPTCQRALAILEGVERRMHHALVFGKNPLAAIGSKVMKWMLSIKRPATFVEMLDEFQYDARENELQEVLKQLVATNKLATSNGALYTLAGKFAVIGNPRASGVDIVRALNEMEETPGSNLKALPL